MRAAWLALAALLALGARGEDGGGVPGFEFHSTVRARYEWMMGTGESRFGVRNARMSVAGKVAPVAGYKAEADFSDKGEIKILDVYVSLYPAEGLGLRMGHMRVPFTIDAHRSPHTQYFADRSFIAKESVRDMGAVVEWRSGWRVPLTLEGGVFNGPGPGSLDFALKAQVVPARGWTLSGGCRKGSEGDVRAMFYSAGGFWDDGRWHVEAEYLRKNYRHRAFAPVDAVDVFGVYRLPLKKVFTGISFVGRYDWIGADGGAETEARHRLTGGVTLSLGRAPLQADIRLNYEQSLNPRTPSDRSKAVVELVARF